MSIRPLGVSGWNTKMFLLSSVNGFSSAFGSFPSFFWEKTFSPRFFHGPVIASWNRLKLASPPTSVHVLLTSGSPGGHLTCLLVCLELLLFFRVFQTSSLYSTFGKEITEIGHSTHAPRRKIIIFLFRPVLVYPAGINSWPLISCQIVMIRE